MNAMAEMPRYQSHKRVWALKIAAIEIHEDKSATIAPKDAGYAVFATAPGWAERFTGSEDDLGVYVLYEGGFASWSPTKAFDDGYSPIGVAGVKIITSFLDACIAIEEGRAFDIPKGANISDDEGRFLLQKASRTGYRIDDDLGAASLRFKKLSKAVDG